MKKFLILVLVLLAACSVQEKVYVANEDSGTVSVIDPSSLKELSLVSLKSGETDFSPHNVQVGRVEIFGDVILATAVSKSNNSYEAHEDGADQLIVIGKRFGNILKRISLESGAHPAHVVSDGRLAYVTGTEKDALYIVNPAKEVFETVRLPNGSMPHGLRLSDDKLTAVIAGLGGKLILVNLTSKEVASYDLPGKGVQTAVAGNNYYVSVYDTGQIGVLENNELAFIDLGADSKGPIQIYPSNDGKFLYAADQGVLFDQPEGNYVYKIDLNEKRVIQKIDAGKAPHGVVVSPDGRVWVTNLKGNSLSVIKNDVKFAEIPIGEAPNGVSFG